jgi:hypothetical protein
MNIAHVNDTHILNSFKFVSKIIFEIKKCTPSPCTFLPNKQTNKQKTTNKQRNKQTTNKQTNKNQTNILQVE